MAKFMKMVSHLVVKSLVFVVFPKYLKFKLLCVGYFSSLDQFGCLVWSHSETHLLYVAERKRPTAESFFQVLKQIKKHEIYVGFWKNKKMN